MFCSHPCTCSTGTRQSASVTASVSLLDVLHEVPTLPEILTPDSQKALAATCKSCRLQFIAQVRVVTAVHPDDYALILERRWPRLSMIVLQGQFAHTNESPPPNIMSFNIHVKTRGSANKATISLLRPLHNPATDLPCTCSAAQQLAHQMRLRWPSVIDFGMSNVHDLDGWGLGVVLQLVKGTWTHLAHLSLSWCELKATSFLILSQGNWPRLKFLDVSGNCLDAEGMALLVRGNWPLLRTILLSFDPTKAAVAVAHLSAANWLIGDMLISHTPFSADLAAALADLQLPNLSFLHLSGSDLTAAAVSELAQADWPRLKTLSLDLHDLDAVAVLLGVDEENLQDFKSDARVLAAVSKPIMLSWPNVAMWPHLLFLRFTMRNLPLAHQVSP